MQVVGLSGYARTGKDTVASIMKEFGWERRSFADKLKEAVRRLDPLIEGEMRLSVALKAHGPEQTKNMYPEYRRLLQVMGTEVGRDMFGTDFWVDQALKGMDEDGKYVFTDCRFLNEADAVHNIGGVVWRIHRPGYGPVNGHASETSLDDYKFDQHIVNSAGLPNLQQRVKDLCLASV